MTGLVPAAVRRLGRRVLDLWRADRGPGFFDAFARRDLGPVLDKFGLPLPRPDPAPADRDVPGAVAFLLGVMFTTRRAPTVDSVAARYRLTPRAIENVRAALAERPWDRPRRAYEARVDLRQAYPLGLTPAHRGEFLEWLLRYGRPDLGLTADEAVWFTLHQAIDPAHGLIDAYLLQPEWQKAVPHALTPAAWPELLDWVDRTHGPFGPWLREPTLAAPWFEAPPGGVNVIAHYRYPSGLQEEAVQYVRTLRHAGVPVARRDAPITYPAGDADPESYLDPEAFDVSLVKIGACEPLDAQYVAAGLHPRPGVYRVACWSWELEAFPTEPLAHAGLADEVWAPSEFCAAAVRRVLPDRPVVAMLPAVAAPPDRAWSRAHFGLADGRFLVAFLFDMGSVMERKNPLGLIRAFRRAFRRDEPADLVLKVSRASARPADRDALFAAAEAAGVVVIDRVMPRDEAFGLTAACDCYASLHRAEGFGFTMAEAMMMGKPVVATRYSANLDFMTPETGYLVDYELVPVGEGRPPYPADAKWAEPSEAHAAELLRRVYEHRDEARQVGERAAARAREVFSLDAAAARMTARLAAIRRARASG